MRDKKLRKIAEWINDAICDGHLVYAVSPQPAYTDEQLALELRKVLNAH